MSYRCPVCNSYVREEDPYEVNFQDAHKECLKACQCGGLVHDNHECELEAA